MPSSYLRDVERFGLAALLVISLQIVQTPSTAESMTVTEGKAGYRPSKLGNAQRYDRIQIILWKIQTIEHLKLLSP